MEKQKNIRLVVCDMAGTTVRDQHEVEMCFTRAAVATSLEMTSEETLAVQGWAKRHVFEVFWERQIGQRDDIWLQQVEKSYGLFKMILEEYYINTPILPTEGCIELFSFLKEHDIPVALTTGFYRQVTNIILDKLGWLQSLNKEYVGDQTTIIQASLASDEVKHGRPHPDMIFRAMQLLGIKNAGNVINIGDTPSDIQSGRNAGCMHSFCVTNGTHSADQLLPHQPDKAFTSLKDFKNWLEAELVSSQ